MFMTKCFRWLTGHLFCTRSHDK